MQLSCTDGIGPITARGLIEHFGSASEVLRATNAQLREVAGAKHRLIGLLRENSGKERAEEELRLLQSLENKGHPISLLFWGEQNYSPYLAHCVDAPLVLYVRGTIPTDAPMIAIVGTRRNTYYAEEALRYLISGFAAYRSDLVIVSGLAFGVDKLAHELALEYGLRTVAIVAHGHHTLYPSVHRGLADKIISNGGGIATEYTYQTGPLPPRFVSRNRIIAGLSQATILVESAARGGALITGNIAFDYGRQVYAVPGRIFDHTSDGCNKMIAIQKASIITTPDQILKDLNLLASNTPKQVPLPFQSDTNESLNQEDKNPIINELRIVGELSVEDLALRLGENLSTISAQLFDLELDNKIRALPGGKYTIRNA